MGNILIILVLIAIVSSIVIKMVKDKKAGKTSCGCGCESCALKGACHKNQDR